MGPTPLDVANAWLTGSDLIDRYWPLLAVLAVLAVAAAVITLAWRALRRAARHVDGLLGEQQQTAADTDSRKEKP